MLRTHFTTLTLAALTAMASLAGPLASAPDTSDTCTTSGGYRDNGGDTEIFCARQCGDDASGGEVDCVKTSSAIVGPGFDDFDCTCDGDNSSSSSNPCCHVVVERDSGNLASIGSCPNCGATGICSVVGGGNSNDRAEAKCS